MVIAMTDNIIDLNSGYDPAFDELYRGLVQVINEVAEKHNINHETVIGIIEQLKMDLHLSIRTDVFGDE